MSSSNLNKTKYEGLAEMDDEIIEARIQKEIEQNARKEMNLRLIEMLMNLSPREREVWSALNSARTKAKGLALEEQIRAFSINLFLQSQKIEEGRKLGYAQSITDKVHARVVDDTLGRLAGAANEWAMRRASSSNSYGLISVGCFILKHSHNLMGAIDRQIEIFRSDPNETRDILFDYALHVYDLVEHLNELCSKHPDAAKGLGQDFPNWPFLIFDRKSVSSDFQDIAARIDLGKTCVVNTGQLARYHWGSMNRYVFDILWRWQSAHRASSWSYKNDTRSRLEKVEAFFEEDFSKLSDKGCLEAKIYCEALDLPSLTKERAVVSRWAKNLIMPLVELEHEDLSDEPAFAVAINNAPYKTRKSHLNSIRKAVEDALWTMAKPGGDDAGSLPSSS